MNDNNDCYSANDDNLRSMPACLEQILEQITPLPSEESVPLTEALDRVLAKPLYAAAPVPPHINSAMDGYAFNSEDLACHPSLTVIGQAYAGHPFTDVIKPGQCINIMTGAPLPNGCNTVVMRERVEISNDQIQISGPVSSGENIRHIGEDLPQGALALEQGIRLTPAALGLAASLGMEKLPVYPRVKVALCSTGDEINPPGNTLPTGGIYDSNRFSLYGLLQRLGAEIIDLGIIPDTPAALEAAMIQGANQADVVISSGGVSIGEADYTRSVLARVGSVDFWRMAMRPGRPMAFGNIKNSLFFGLPGNPVAVMVTFLMVVQPALRKLMGEDNWEPAFFPAIAAESLKGRTGRIDYSRGIYHINPEGQLEVRTTGNQGSGILSSMVSGNCLIELDEQQSQINAGDPVKILPFADRL